MRTASGPSVKWLLRHMVLMAGAVVMLGPFILTLSGSLKPGYEIVSAELTLLPQEEWAIVENYGRALGAVPLLRFMLNGVIVCTAILIIQLLVAVPAAYSLAKLHFRGREVLLALVLLGLMIPIQVPALPLYVMAFYMGLIDSYLGLVMPFMISVFAIFLLRQFFKTIPDDLIYAARLDGFSELEIVWRIVVPASMPAIIAFSIFSIVQHWNDLFWPLIVISSTEMATPPLGIVFFRNEEVGDDYGAMMAATVMITAPLVVMFLFAQQKFIEGITFTGMRG